MNDRHQQIRAAIESDTIPEFLAMTGSNPPGPWCMGDLVSMGLARKDYELDGREVIGWDWTYLGDNPIRVFGRIIRKGDTTNG